MKRKILLVLFTILLTVIAIVLCANSRTSRVISSSVYQNSEETKIQMFVNLNTLFNVDIEKIAKEIISEHQEINGVRNNTIYMLHLFRTKFHYRRNWEYGTIICDEKGAIICCKKDLGV